MVGRYLEMARPYDVRGLRAFAADMRAKWEDSEAELEGRPDAEEQAVRLITMHSAKGLEWPIVLPVNTMTTPQRESGLLHNRSTDTLHHYLGPVRDITYEGILENERAQQDRERVRLLYVACTRASELLVIPNLSVGKSGWLDLVDLNIEALPPIDFTPYDLELPAVTLDRDNQQDRDTFAAEAKRIVQSTRTIEWRQPSRHEMADEDAMMAQAVAEVFVEEEATRPEILGGPLRGTILHKLMEEVLSGETTDDVNSLESRATELLAELGETPAEDPATGLVPNELAQTVTNTFSLPEVVAIKDRLRAEFSIFDHQVVDGEPRNEVALSGVADALVIGETEEIELVVDWKSDVSPTNARRQKYRSQVQDYLEASGASNGLIVYMTLGQVDEISAKTRKSTP